MNENNLKSIKKDDKPLKSAMVLFSAKKPCKSTLLNSTEKVLAEDSDESCNSFSQNKENVRKNINFRDLDDSENNSSFLCKRSPFHQSFDNSNNSFNELNKQSPLFSRESEIDKIDSSVCQQISFLNGEDSKNLSKSSPIGLSKRQPLKERTDTYDSSFIDDDNNNSFSEPSSVSTDEKENDIFLEGDILTPPAAHIPKSERKVTTKSKFVDYRKCVTEKKVRHNVHKECSPIKKRPEKLLRKRIVILSDSSDEGNDNKSLPDISIPVNSTPIVITKDTKDDSSDDSSSSDGYGIEKIKASVRKTIAAKAVDDSLDRSSVAIDNEFLENGKEYDNSFIDDSVEESSSSSNSSYDSDDYSSEDLYEVDAENSLICDVNSADDTDSEHNSDHTKAGDSKRKTSKNKPRTSKSLTPKDGDLAANEKIEDQVYTPRTQPVQRIVLKAANKQTKTFLSSLSMENLGDERVCHPDALKYIKQYSRHKKELAKRYLNMGCLHNSTRKVL